MSRDLYFLGVHSVVEMKAGKIASQAFKVQFHALNVVAPKSFWGQCVKVINVKMTLLKLHQVRILAIVTMLFLW